MTKKVVKNTSESFRRILSKTQGTFIKRKALVDLAQLEYSMSRKDADGLVDMNIFMLKKNGLIHAEGDYNNRGYAFQLEFLDTVRQSPQYDAITTLIEEKKSVEMELQVTKHELTAYQDLLRRIPQKKSKIIKLSEKTTERISQLEGKLRALNQIVAT